MANEHSTALVVFAKVPGRRIAKTRIAAQSDWATAERIYGELLDATARTVKAYAYYVAYTGGRVDLLVPYFASARDFFAQEGKTLGERLYAAARRLWPKGHRAACFIGCDCPEMGGDTIESAFTALEEGADVVLGPAHDGGYYLAGCTRRGECIFDAHGWGTPDLLEETIKIVRASGLTAHFLPPRGDIDTLDDYHTWKGSTP